MWEDKAESHGSKVETPWINARLNGMPPKDSEGDRRYRARPINRTRNTLATTPSNLSTA